MELSKQELDRIVEGCKRNDRTAQKKLYEFYYGKMMGVCLRYAKSPEQAKDILQDSFIKVFRNMKMFSDTGSFEGWLRRVVTNTAIDHFRKKKKDHVLLGEEWTVEDFGDAEADESQEKQEEEALTNLKAEEAMKALQQLSPAYRSVFNLYVVENYSHQEIADILDISVGTSKSNLAKAKRNLRKLLKK